MKSFYLTLVSGACQTQFSNTASKFTNKIPVPLDFEDNVEFGICELSYKKRVNNMKSIKSGFGFYDHLYKTETKPPNDRSFNIIASDPHSTSEVTLDVQYGKFYYFDVAEACYENEDELSRALNETIWKKIPRLQSIPIFVYERSLRRFAVYIKDRYLTLFLRDPIPTILGIRKDMAVIGMDKQQEGYKYEGEYRKYRSKDPPFEANTKGGLLQFESGLEKIDTFFIYCDLVQQQYSGDTFSNLLRMCPIRGRDNERVVETFQKIHYLPISKRHVDSIEIHIKTIEDTFIDLCDITYVKLHFRKRKH